MTTSPTIREFQETVRSAFEYLGREFAFQEVEPPAAQLEANPFLIWFANAVTLVQVEGINHGFAAQVILGRAGAGGEWHATVSKASARGVLLRGCRWYRNSLFRFCC